jgi:hypothetical protein
VITFNCGPATHTIQFSVSKAVNLGNVTLDGGGRIVLNAGPNERHFFVGPARCACTTSPCKAAIRSSTAGPSRLRGRR